jgi:tetratricopeptide (TPR) repeat protein
MHQITSMQSMARLLAALAALLLCPSNSVKAQPAEWVNLSQEASAFYDQGNYRQAIVIARQSLSVAEENLGPDHPVVATTLNFLGLIYFKQGQYEQAQPLFKRSLAIMEKALGPEHPDVALTLSYMAYMHYRNSQYTLAESLFMRSLTIHEKALGPDHLDLATTLNNLAEVYFDQGQHAQAEQFHKRALSINEKALGPDHPSVARSLNNLAALYQAQGQYARSEASYKRSLAINEKVLGSEHPSVANNLSNLALMYNDTGQYEKAEVLHKQALAIREKSLGPEHTDTALSLNNLAELYRLQGRDLQALQIYMRALEINLKAKGPDHLSVAINLNNLALLYEMQGRFEQAELLYKRSLSIDLKVLNADHPEVGKSLNNIAGLYIKQGRYEEAIPLIERSLAISETVFGPEHPLVASTLNNLGLLYQLQERYALAEQPYLRSLAIREKILRPDHPDVAISQDNLALLYEKQGKYSEALPYSRRSVAIMRNRIIAEASDTTIQRGLEEKQYGAYFYFHTRLLNRLVSSGASDAESLRAEAFEVFQLAGSTEVGAAMTQSAMRFTADTPALAVLVRARQDGAARWKLFDKQLVDLLSKPAEQRNAEAEKELRERIAKTEAEIRQIDASLLRDFPAYRELTSSEPISLADAQKLLGSGEALVSWLVGNDETLLFLISPDRVEFLKLDSGRERLLGLVKKLRTATDLPGYGDPLPFPHAEAHELYKILFGPIDKYLEGIEQLILVPDGPLQSLSFGLLKADAPQRLPSVAGETAGKDVPWLARRYSLTTLPAITSLRALRKYAKTPGQREPFIGFGDPELKGQSGDQRGFKIAKLFARGAVADTRAVSEMWPLPETADELRSIAKTLKAGPDSIYLRQDATETRVKMSRLNKYRTVAFATHGIMAGEFRGIQEPALVLTPPAQGTEDDDGLLTASPGGHPNSPSDGHFKIPQ